MDNQETEIKENMRAAAGKSKILDGVANNAWLRRLILFIIIILQILLMGYWATQKSNYYIDELFSFGSAHDFTLDKKQAKYIDLSDDWKYEEWTENAVLKAHLHVTEETSVLSQPPLAALRMLLFRRSHQGLLNIVMSLFSPGKVDKYPGIILNLVIFFFTQILMYSIMKELTGNYWISQGAVIMYGFSAMAISTSMYVRFYALVIFFLLALIRLHQIMWRTENLLKCELLTICSMALIYLAMKNSELVFILGGSLVGFYTIGLVRRKQYKKAALYFLTVVPVSLVYAITKTNFVDILLHPANYANNGGAEGWMTHRLLTVNADRLLALQNKFSLWFSNLLFGSRYIKYIFIVMILILLEMKLLGKKPGKKAKTSAKVAGQIDESRTNSTEEDTKSLNTGLVFVVLGVAAVYLVFAYLTAFPAIRYISLLFPLAAMLLWALINWLTKNEKHRNMLIGGFLVMTIAGIAVCQLMHPDNVDYIYKGDTKLIQAVQDSGITDVVVVTTNDGDANHSIYECVNLMPDEAGIYPVNEEKHHIGTANAPERLLVWIHANRDIEPYIEDLTEAGYELSKLGKTHASDVYVAERQEQ